MTVGAHPGFPDREGFGRRECQVTADEVTRLILDQVDQLRKLANGVGVDVGFLKPHGSLYNQAQRDTDIARGVRTLPFGRPVGKLKVTTKAPMKRHEGGYYIRLMARDLTGTAATIATLVP